jgi:hypothetical protein
VNLNTVISTLSWLAAQQDQLATAEGSLAANMVEVYRSLGSGWQIRSSGNPIDLVPAETHEEMLERNDYWEHTFQDRKLPRSCKQDRTYKFCPAALLIVRFFQVLDHLFDKSPPPRQLVTPTSPSPRLY